MPGTWQSSILQVFEEIAAPDAVDIGKSHAIWVPEERADIEIFDGPWDFELSKKLLPGISNTLPPTSDRNGAA